MGMVYLKFIIISNAKYGISKISWSESTQFPKRCYNATNIRPL